MAYRQTPAIKQRLEETRARIVASATALIYESGYAGCSMVAVAEHAGIATGTIYRFFPSKGELFAEVFRTACAKEVAAASAAAQRSVERGEPTEALVEAVRTFATRALKAPKLAYALIAEPVDPLVEVERLQFRSAYTDLLASGISTCIELGLLPSQNPRFTGAGIIGAISEVLIAPLGNGGADPDVLPEIESFVRRTLGLTEEKEPSHGNS
ncbi:TetR/AcrR family transcriptional regulator [Antrihabitans cavernicola]|uniref:TetR/AcrR family transcriptional regulator n=1 Tax=Antrihabitans cavernicola TaxID=2495913 RepID=A0A5A7S7J5_9NOCA|nr:TetR/AcrR family transcriptional regulator [Spelaeibacter cavernicola]KAA0021159.1 TetR/AcrR family transcriptional regulator [Spelaeibacter cavernicola]